MTAIDKTRVLVIGLDSVDPSLTEARMSQARLPNLARRRLLPGTVQAEKKRRHRGASFPPD
ncbi:MAG: hypothetical protein AB7O49_20735 [Sphingomonadales bacterium]